MMLKNNSTIQRKQEKTSLGNVATLKMGPFGSNIPISCFVESGIPVVSGSHLFVFKISDGPFNFVTPQKADQLISANAFPGDVVITHSGTIGQVSMIPRGARYKRYVLSQRQFLVRPDPDKLDSLFLTYYLRSPYGQYLLKANSSSVGVPSISKPVTYLRSLELLLPKIDIQRRIASILLSFDDKIENNNRIIATLETMAQGTFKEWFVKFRFTGYENVKFVDSEMGKIPEGWQVKRLDEISDVSIGRTPPREQTQWFTKNPHGVKWISIKDLGQVDKYIFDTAESLTEEAVKKFNIPIIPPNTIVISFKLTLGKMAVTTERMTSNEAIANFVLKKGFNVPIEYLFMFLRRVDLGNLGSTSSIGTAINSKMVRRIEVLVPDKDTVERFEITCGHIFSQMKSIVEENHKLTLARDSLLPKLMSGKLLI